MKTRWLAKLSLADPWDAIGVLGAVLVLAGVAAIYWPASMILGGSAALTLYYFRERYLVPQSTAPRNDGRAAGG